MTTKAVAYIRVSLDKQAEHGVSLDAQRQKIEAYCQLYDVEVVEVIVDAGLSAKTLAREGLQNALAMLRSGKAGAIVVAKLDRLTRSVRDLGELVDTYFAAGKHALLSVGEQIDTRSAAGRLVLNVLASVAQWERETIGERTSAAMQVMKAQGKFTGGAAAPFGFRLIAGELVRDEQEQAVIAAARKLRGQGLSLRRVSDALAAQGHVARNGKPFAAQQIANMVEAG